MYEPVKDAWTQYSHLLAKVEPKDEKHWKMSAEVHGRLGQLDIILAKLQDELHAASQRSGKVDDNLTREAWDMVSIFTDSFYFFAWRLIDILNGDGKGTFPRLEPVEAASLISVREHLLDSPEKRGQYFMHGMELREELLAKLNRAIATLQDED